MSHSNDFSTFITHPHTKIIQLVLRKTSDNAIVTRGESAVSRPSLEVTFGV